MRRNIEVVKDIRKEIENFQLLSDDIDLMIRTEKCDITDLFENDDIRLKKVVEIVEKVVDYTKELTEDFRDTLDYSVGDDGGFDCSSLECLGRHACQPVEGVFLRGRAAGQCAGDEGAEADEGTLRRRPLRGR